MFTTKTPSERLAKLQDVFVSAKAQADSLSAELRATAAELKAQYTEATNVADRADAFSAKLSQLL